MDTSHRDIRAISTVLSVLLLIMIAMTSSLITYSWVSRNLSLTTEKAEKAMQIQGISREGANLKIYVMNVGKGLIVLRNDSSVYVNGVLRHSQISPETLSEGSVATIIVNDVALEKTIKVKVASVDGINTEASQDF